MSHPERILGIDRTALESLHGGPLPNGFIPDIPLHRIIEQSEFRVRDSVESDPSFKQIIPYVVFRFRSSERLFFFAYARGKSGAESRLHSLLSLGLGGHVEESDFPDSIISIFGYQQALWRELSEEVNSVEPFHPSISLGLINDDSNPVGSVHLGIFHVVSLNSPTLWGAEIAIASPRFLGVELLLAMSDQFESWSKILIDSGRLK